MPLIKRIQEKGWLSFLIVGIVAVVVQQYQLSQLQADPTVNGPIIDGRQYHYEAKGMIQGLAAPKEPHWQSPMFPWVLALAYRVGGAEPIKGIYLQALLAVLIALLILSIARRFLTPVLALTSGLIACLYGPLLFYCSQLIPAPLAAVTALASLYLATVIKREAPIHQHGVLGMATGVAMAVRGNLAPFVLWLLIRPFFALPKSDATFRALGVICGVLIGLAPVAISNYSRAEILSLSTSNLGVNLYLGNNEDIAKSTAIRPGHEWDELLSEPARAGAIAPMERSRYFEKKSLQWMTNHPIDWLTDVLKKTSDLVHGKEISRNLDSYGRLGHTPLSAALVWDRGLKFPFGLVFPLAIFGFLSTILLKHKQKEALRTVLWFVVLNGLGIVIFFPTGRYRLALVLALIPVALLGIQSIWLCIRQHIPPPTLSSIAAVLIFAWSNLSPVFTGPDMSNQANLQLGWAYVSSGNLEKASSTLEREVLNRPDRADSWRTLAEVRDRLGNRQGAIEALQRAVEIAPNFAHALQHLGILWNARKRFRNAILVLENCVVSDPGHPLAWANLARAYIGLNDFSSALYAAQRAVEVNPNYGRGHLYLGIAMRRTGDPKGALPWLRRSAKRMPNDPRPHNQLARCLLDLGKIEDAKKVLKYTIKRWPKYRPVRRLLENLR